MGIVWEAYHKGVPSLGVPQINLDFSEVNDINAVFTPNTKKKQVLVV